MKIQDDRYVLTDEEHEDFIEDITVVTSSCISQLIKIADNRNIDRDSVVQYFSDMFAQICDISTFEHFEEGDSDGS